MATKFNGCKQCMKKCVYLEISESAMVLWLPRYYRDSKVAIRVEPTRTGGDRNINGHVMLVLMSSSCFERIKHEKKIRRKKTKTKIKTVLLLR